MNLIATIIVSMTALCTLASCSAQTKSYDGLKLSTDVSEVNGTPFQYYSLSDAKRDYDLNAYLAPGSSNQNPLLVMVQGSGCDSVFTRNQKDQMQSSAGQDIITSLSGGRYNVLIVDKPHVEIGTPQTGGQMDECSQEFRRQHALDEWTAALSDSIDFIKKERFNESGAVRILGLSEGALVAARLARMRSDVSHVTFISSFGCHQIDDMLVSVRRNWMEDNPEANGQILQDGVAKALAEAEEQFRIAFKNPEDYSSVIFGQTPKFWSTFGLACPAEDLAYSDAKVFLAYGTSDEQISADGIEEIVSRRILARKETKTVRVIGGNHILRTSSETQPFENLIGVFQEALNWMNET